MRRVRGQTKWQQEKRPPGNGEQHADDIELHKIVLECLDHRTCVGPSRINASLLALPDAPQEDQPRRNAECDEGDDEGAECPTPSRMVVEILRNLRAGENCCNGWRCEDAVHDDTVAERRRIGQDNCDNIQKTDVTDL